MTLPTLENPPIVCREEAQDPSGVFITFLSRFTYNCICVRLKLGAWENPRHDEHKAQETHSHGSYKNRERNQGSRGWGRKASVRPGAL